MNPAHDARSEPPVSDCLWLELSLEGRAHAFPLEASETSVVTVGSHASADFRIARHGVAPIQFHVERDAGHLWIVPAYGADRLRLDTARVLGPKRISSSVVIEFCGVRLKARVLEEKPCVPEQATVRFSPSASSTVTPVQRTVVIEPIRMIPLEPSGRVRPATCGPSEVPISRTESGPLPENGRAHDTVQLAPFWLRDVDRLPTGANTGTQCTTVFDAPCIRPQHTVFSGWLARLGVHAQRRPRTVWLAGTTCAFILSASLSFVTTRVEPTEAPRAAPSLPVTPIRAASLAPTSTFNPDPIVIIPAASPPTTSVAKQGEPGDPELLVAVGHMISGRYKDAQQAYAALATRSPVDASLAVVARLLARKTAPECSISPTETTVSCPEVRQ